MKSEAWSKECQCREGLKKQHIHQDLFQGKFHYVTLYWHDRLTSTLACLSIYHLDFFKTRVQNLEFNSGAQWAAWSKGGAGSECCKDNDDASITLFILLRTLQLAPPAYFVSRMCSASQNLRWSSRKCTHPGKIVGLEDKADFSGLLHNVLVLRAD